MNLMNAQGNMTALDGREAVSQNAPARVLVVDDEKALRETIGRILAIDRYEVETVSNGADALSALEQRKFDLVIVDYTMPVMKGDALAAAIRNRVPNQPILMVTAYGESLRFEGNYPLSVNKVIGKPFTLNDFREAVRQLAGV